MSPGPYVTSPDGRVVTYEVSGATSGWPVFLLHGTPGSRMGPKPRNSVLYRLGVRLISHDRPGYGGSTRHEGRCVADVAKDVQSIADCLEIEHFSVVGRSGGGPHALACAALLPGRVVRTGVLVGLAPADAPDLDWFAGMTKENTHEFTTAVVDAPTLTERLRLRADRAMRDPDSLLAYVREQGPKVDRPHADGVSMRRLFANTYQEALKDGPYGWVDDAVALQGEWGFRLEDVKGEVLLWHGAEDTFAPVAHTKWMASRIANAQVQVQEGAAHFGAVHILPDVLGWLAASAEDVACLRRDA